MKNLLKWNAVALIMLASCGSSYAEGPLKFNPAGAIYSDEKKEGLFQPEGVGCGSPSILIVADSGNGRLLQFSADNETIVPGKEIRLPQSSYPIRAQVNSKGEILVLDGKTRRIARISPAGEFGGYLEVKGAPGSENIVPRSFIVDGKDTIYILDIFSGRVLVLGASGNYSREIGFPSKYGFISDLSVDASGTIFLIDSVDGKVYVGKNDSREVTLLSKDLKEYCDFPASLAVDNKGRIYVSDKNGSRVVVLGKDGSFQGQQLSMGWKEGFLRYPSQICVNDKGKIFIADTGNNRIQTFTVAE